MKLETVTQVGRSDLLLYDRRKGKYRKRGQKTEVGKETDMKAVRQTRKQRQTGLRQRDRHEGSETDTQAETDRPEAKRQT